MKLNMSRQREPRRQIFSRHRESGRGRLPRWIKWCQESFTASLLSEWVFKQRLSRNVQLLGRVSEDCIQCDPQRLVMGNRHVVLAASSGGQAHVAAGLARTLIAVAPKQESQSFAIEVAW